MQDGNCRTVIVRCHFNTSALRSEVWKRGRIPVISISFFFAIIGDLNPGGLSLMLMTLQAH